MNNKLKIAINICGHLRGYKSIPYIKNFFNSYNINYINEKLNTNYESIEIEYYLYTVEEININHNHIKYMKHVYPEKYREYTFSDFNNWLNEFKKEFNFKNLEVVNQKEFYYKIYNSFGELINQINKNSNIPRFSDATVSMFFKREESMKLIDNNVDIIFNIRPDLVFKYEIGSDTHDFDNIIIQTLNERKENTVYVPLLNSVYINDVISNDFYHYGLYEPMQKFFKNMTLNNLLLYKEFSELNENQCNTIYKIIHYYVHHHIAELKQMINYKLGTVMTKHSLYIRTDLEMIDTPFDINICQYDTVYNHQCNKI